MLRKNSVLIMLKIALALWILWKFLWNLKDSENHSLRTNIWSALENQNKYDNINIRSFSSVQFIRSVVSDSLWPHESQHSRPPCPSPTPRVHSDSCPSSQWCHPAISSSVIPFSSCPQFLPASESFPTVIIINTTNIWEMQLNHKNFQMQCHDLHTNPGE